MIDGKVIKAIIPARMTSSRLPGKVMLDLAGKPALQRIIERVRSARLLDGVVIATTTNPQDDFIEKFCAKIGCECFRGSENDVLDRTVKAAQASNTDVIVDLTSDCPLIDPRHIDHLVSWHMRSPADMTTNILTRTFPRGYDLRIVDTRTLEKVQSEVDNGVDKEHAFTWIYLHPQGSKNYKVQNWSAPPEQNRPDIEVTLDTPEDLALIRFIYGFEGQGYNQKLTCEEVIHIIDSYPEQYAKVARVERKDYFAELEAAYAFVNAMEKYVVEGVREEGKEPVGIFNANKELKQNEQVPSVDSRSGKSGKSGRSAGK